MPNDTSAVIDDDMFTPSVIADPYTYYGRLREIDPVHWNDLHKVWVVTGYDDITWLTRHPDLFSSAVPAKDPLPPYPPIDEHDRDEYEYVQRGQSDRMVTRDRPSHRAMRGALHDFFTPAASERWRPMIRDIIDHLLDGAAEAKRMDVIADFAVPLPLHVIFEVMAIPEDDRPYVRSVAAKLLVGPRVSGSRMREIAAAMRSINEYMAPLVDRRAIDPGEDLVSLIAVAEAEGLYTRSEALQNLGHLVVAGHETSANLIANGLLAFIRNPDQWELLRTDPDRLAASATEECLRYDPAVKSIERIANEQVELRGRTIGALERIRWFIASANRDPDRFHEPDTFDITRNPNPHLSFGHGIHLCLGAAIARIEGQEALKALADRCTSLQLACDDLEYVPAAHLRALRRLEVSWS